jgi:twitching motility protein PilT
MELGELLQFAVKNKASDVHLSAGLPPMLRVDGELKRVSQNVLDNTEVMKIASGVMTDRQRKVFEETLETDFSIEVPNLSRFRVNAFMQARGVGIVFRLIPDVVKDMEALGLPPIFTSIASYPRGLVLVTGPTGSGKSTTLAAMVDYINKNRHQHILTIEDPIEFVHESKQCLVNQREVHRDTFSFNAALRSSLREDPDIILVGELRDIETIRLAMTAAETGHLVFGTLHTSSATKTVNRIIDVFPGDEKPMARSMLSESLQAVISQGLVKKVGGGRALTLEIMICTGAIRNLIREDKVAQMYSVIQTGQSLGMQTLDQHLAELVFQGVITKETAQEVAVNKANV